MSDLSIAWLDQLAELWRRERATGWAVEDGRAVIIRSALLSFGTACAWSVLLCAAIVHMDGESRVLMCGVIAGVLAVGAITVATLPLASLAFLAGGMMVVVPGMHILDLPDLVFPMLGIFGVLLARSVLAQARLVDLVAVFREVLSESGAAERERRRHCQPRFRQLLLLFVRRWIAMLMEMRRRSVASASWSSSL